MALRIGPTMSGPTMSGGMPSQMAPMAPASEPLVMPEEMTPEAPDALASEMPMMPDGGGRVDPEVARYLEPSYRCHNCVHFMDPNQCEIVAGPIQPDGVCSLYTPDSAAMDQPADETIAMLPAETEGEE